MPLPNTDGGTAATAPSPAPAEAPAGRRPSELTLRILSALVLLPIAVGEVWFGGYAFLGFVIVFCLACSYEWAKLTAPGRVALAACIVAVPLVVATVASFHDAEAGGATMLLAGMPLLAVAFGALRFDRPTAAAFGLPYIGLAAVSLVWLRQMHEGGLFLVVAIFLIVWGTDIFAYIAGRSLGGPKLAPRFSPKKTWSGLIGGMAGAAVGGAVAYAVWAQFGKQTGIVWPLLGVWAASGAGLAVVAQIGDLFESGMKRRAGVKDSSRLIPGHGGVLDRVDGLLTAAPVFALLVGTKVLVP